MQSFFFFQAEDGIRDVAVTGVQTCALPILHRPPAQVAAFDESPHTSGHMAELMVMSCRQLEPLFIGQCNKSLGLLLMECEWLLHIDVASAFQANPRNIEMAFRRRRDVDNVWSGVTQKISQVAVIPFDREPLVELPCH